MLKQSFHEVADKALVISQSSARLIAGAPGAFGTPKKSKDMRESFTDARGWYPVMVEGTNQVIGLVEIERSSGPYMIEAIKAFQPQHHLADQDLDRIFRDKPYVWHFKKALAFETPLQVSPLKSGNDWASLSTEDRARIKMAYQKKPTTLSL